MRKDIEKKFPLPKAIAYVVLSVVVVWGTLFVSWWYHDYTVKRRTKNSHFTIQGIVSSCSDPDFLTSRQLATILGLATKEPLNLYAFDPQEAQRKCERFPAIKSAHVGRLRPNAVVVSYEMRKPYVRLADFEDVALDQTGYPFPLYPIYSPKRLPEVYLGLTHITWNEQVITDEFSAACELLGHLEQILPKTMRISRIDTHNMNSPSRGRREIVVVLEDAKCLRYVRLHTQDYRKNLSHFLALLPTLDSIQTNEQIIKEQIIDLRCHGFALVK